MKHILPAFGSRMGAWLQSLNAKLFLLTALLTSALAIAVAMSIIGSFKHSTEIYVRDIAARTARGVIEDIKRVDPELKFRRETSEILATWANPESVNQIDLFAAAVVDGEGYVEVWATSAGRPEAVLKDDAEIIKMMEMPEERIDLVKLGTGQTVWRVHAPIYGANGRKAKALLRAYCSLDRWNAVWNSTLAFTLKTLPIALLVEFALLWALTSTFVRRPMQKIMQAMKSLGGGDPSARASLNGNGELGQIAGHFDAMASELQRISQEREVLLAEIQGFNAALQGRIDEALSELQAKNDELEVLMERISILREELGQQERLAVAGQLTAAFAHEVGTPLNLVDSHLQMLISDPDIDGQTHDRLGTIHGQIVRVGEIVKKLLGLARPAEPKRGLVQMNTLLAELQRLWAPSLAAHKVSFRAQIPEGCALQADRRMLEQLFINLVNNAVDAMPSGGSIYLSALQNGQGGWEFALADTGVGIPPELLVKVFKPMFTTKPEGEGTGLGLAICRGIIRAHGGEINLESAEGRGATVRFVLPSGI